MMRFICKADDASAFVFSLCHSALAVQAQTLRLFTLQEKDGPEWLQVRLHPRKEGRTRGLQGSRVSLFWQPNGTPKHCDTSVTHTHMVPLSYSELGSEQREEVTKTCRAVGFYSVNWRSEEDGCECGRIRVKQTFYGTNKYLLLSIWELARREAGVHVQTKLEKWKQREEYPESRWPKKGRERKPEKKAIIISHGESRATFKKRKRLHQQERWTHRCKRTTKSKDKEEAVRDMRETEAQCAVSGFACAESSCYGYFRAHFKSKHSPKHNWAAVYWASATSPY